MTKQTQLALTGIAGFAFAKYYLGKDTMTALLIGTSVMSGIALLTTRNVPEGQ